MPPKSTQKLREYLADGDAALREYQETGIAYSLEEVERYVIALARGEVAARPESMKA